MTTVKLEQSLEGIEVAITGRLAALSREEARSRIVAAGGSYVEAPGPGTALLVVGQGGPPLGDDGRPTRALLEADRLRSDGSAIQVVQEEVFLARLDLPEHQASLQRLYTTAQLSRILDVRPSRIRSWVRHGLIEPVEVVRRLSFFEFRAVATARALSRLAESGVTPREIRRGLEQLEAWLPGAERSLALLETLEASGLLVVRTAEGALAEPTGQLCMDFEPTRGPTSARAPTALPSAAPETAEEWFEVGIEAEVEGQLRAAVDAYERSLLLGGPQPETNFNLANTLYALGDRAGAAQRFRMAVELDHDYVEAWNNLGNTLAELERKDAAADAIWAFEQALALQPDYADAHFNLAETLANLGRYAEARVHWRAYLERDPLSSWATVVRERLRRTVDGV